MRHRHQSLGHDHFSSALIMHTSRLHPWSHARYGCDRMSSICHLHFYILRYSCSISLLVACLIWHHILVSATRLTMYDNALYPEIPAQSMPPGIFCRDLLWWHCHRELDIWSNLHFWVPWFFCGISWFEYSLKYRIQAGAIAFKVLLANRVYLIRFASFMRR